MTTRRAAPYRRCAAVQHAPHFFNRQGSVLLRTRSVCAQYVLTKAITQTVLVLIVLTPREASPV